MALRVLPNSGKGSQNQVGGQQVCDRRQFSKTQDTCVHSFNNKTKPHMVAHTEKPSTKEAEARGSLKDSLYTQQNLILKNSKPTSLPTQCP